MFKSENHVNAEKEIAVLQDVVDRLAYIIFANANFDDSNLDAGQRKQLEFAHEVLKQSRNKYNEYNVSYKSECEISDIVITDNSQPWKKSEYIVEA